MPKLQIIAPCQQVIIGQDGSASLIVVISELRFPALPAELPANAATPIRWHVFTQWFREPADQDKLFFQEIKLISRDGKEAITPHEGEFKMTAEFHRMNAVYEVFPVIAEGAYDLVISLREESQKTSIEHGRYTMLVFHDEK